MLKKIEIIYFFAFLILLTSCGFEKINQENNLVRLQNINVVSVDKRLAYKLKNNISLISNEFAKKTYDVEISFTQKKIIKVKDGTGKAKRYGINAITNITLKNIDKQKTVGRVLTHSADYEVGANHSETKNNEKNALKNIIKQVSEDINSFIKISVRK